MKPVLPLSLLFCLLPLHVRADEDPDNDGDGLTDAEEVLLGTDPAHIDTDGDSLTDGYEAELETDPLVEDSDGDTMDDALEIGWTGPGDIDTDGDGLTDGSEVFDHGSDPLDRDSDADGLPDDAEWSTGSGMLIGDSDADGLRDGTEVQIGLDPLSLDGDANGLIDSQEVAARTAPGLLLTPTTLHFGFQRLPFVKLAVQRSLDLRDWQTVEEFAPAPGTQSVPATHTEPHETGVEPAVFFRLRLD